MTVGGEFSGRHLRRNRAIWMRAANRPPPLADPLRKTTQQRGAVRATAKKSEKLVDKG
jgi:hypothetical protein